LLKILDFGLAKVMAGSATLSGELRGTPLYMAPEQLSPAPLSPATDIWAMGLVAFYLLVGKPYWRTGQRQDVAFEAVLKEVGDGSIAPPSQRARQLGVNVGALPRAFDKWFLRCTHQDPQHRFASAGEAARALVVALGLAQNSAESIPVSSSRGTNRHTLAIVAGLVAIGGGTVGWTLVSPLRESPNNLVRNLKISPATPVQPTPNGLPSIASRPAAPIANRNEAPLASAASALWSPQPKATPRRPTPRKEQPTPSPTVSASTSSVYPQNAPALLPPLDPLKHR
jgi:serine/threonine protein kinase